MRGVRAAAVAVAAVAVGVATAQFQAVGGEAAEAARLDALRRDRGAWSEYQHRLVTELVRGRISLAAAVDLLLDASGICPDWLETLDCQFPDVPGRRARVARTLVAGVESEAQAEPKRGSGAAGRVVAEYTGMTAGPH